MSRGFHRAPLLAVALLSMLWGVWLGLARLGWRLPLPSPERILDHGPMFVGGFFGTLITLERAVGASGRAAYAAPVVTAGGAMLLASGRPELAAAAMAGGSALLTLAALVVVWRRPSLGTMATALGAAAWLGGNVQWLAGAAPSQVAYSWIGFLVFMIAGTRIARGQPLILGRPAVVWFAAGALLLAAGILLSPVAPATGARVAAAGLLLLAAWLARYDAGAGPARRHGHERYMAIAARAAYSWLAAAGLIELALGSAPVAFRYDAVLHAVLLGFVMSMVFAHAPLVFPAVLGIALPFRPAFYGHLVLLHASVALRIAGDLVPGVAASRAWGGLLNAAALLLFVANTVRSAALAARPRQAS